MTSTMPWFRLYNETLTDRKIARICRESKQPKALVLGVWVTFLTLASESPHRGYLLISDDLAISTDEIREETGLDEDTFNRIVEGLTFYGMVERENHCWLVCNWEGRQPTSDNSTDRVRRHRERKREEEATNDTKDETVQPSEDDTLQGENNETLPKRFSNVIDKEEETEKETEEDTPLTPQGERGGAAPPKKSEGGRPKKRLARDCPIPESLNTTEFLAHWSDWLKHRSEIRKPATYTAAERQLKQLEKWGLKRAIIAIDHSIANGWQGIFEPKAGQNGNGRPARPQLAIDDPDSVALDPEYRSVF